MFIYLGFVRAVGGDESALRVMMLSLKQLSIVYNSCFTRERQRGAFR